MPESRHCDHPDVLDDTPTTAAYRAPAPVPTHPASQTSSTGAGAILGSGVLVVTRGPQMGGRFVLTQPVTTAGRHPDAPVFLDDVTVSRRHAEFRWLDEEYWVIDVGSLNGTYVNRVPIQSLPLCSGDEIQIGKFRLTFTCQPQPEPHP
ncbi:FHA domain-containing protein [Mycolicibacterium fortuitum]|uniref:FHA domain-containing protein n=1 Tax=Mycolicibacterium fortuitum TaxID=1766 RepID=UPI0026227793|nr:FHA domain-containing protein [Mycolicibacterium fortuitum]